MTPSHASVPRPEGGSPSIPGAPAASGPGRQVDGKGAVTHEWLNALFEAAVDAILVADAESGLLVDVNPAAMRLMGLPRERIVGRHYLELHPPELHEQAADAFRRMVSGEATTAVLAVLASDGRRVPVEIVGGVTTGLAGRRIIGGFFRDVTERRRAAEALERSEERYRQLFELEADAVVLVDVETRAVVDANRRAEHLYGYTREELLRLHSPDLSAEPEKTERTLCERELHVPLRRHRRKDGTILPVEIVTTYFMEAGRTLQVAAIRDVSARLAAEAAQREAMRQHAALLNNLPGYAFRCRNDRDWTVEYISLGVETVTGYPASDFVGNRVRSYGSIVEAADQERVWTSVQTAVQTHRSYVVEYRIRHASGAIRWLWEKGIGIEKDGQVVALEGFATDVTERRRAGEERRRLQAQLLQAQKMESIGRLAGGVAHDFNNLLTVILGYSDMLLSDSLTTAQRGDLEQVRKAGDRARALTSQLLAFSRKQILEIRRVNLNQVITDFSQMLSRLIGEQIAVQTELDPALGWVDADPSQITQVLLNLAVNARDAMPRGGTLTLRTANLSLDGNEGQTGFSLPPGEYVRLEVTDTGCGMDEETQKHVFEPFFTTKEVGRGSGLGLATVYGIVQQHGGHVWFHSRAGEGTTFLVCLPRAAAVATPVEAVSPGAVCGGSESILLVEDDQDVRQMAALFLRRYGYDVVAAGSPGDAVRLAAEMPHLDLLVTDLIMPELNGREVYERVAAVRPGIRVLYMSGYAREVISHHGVLDGGIVFLQKPFSAPVLAGKVREALAQPVGAFLSPST